jgi:hypothetical protein
LRDGGIEKEAGAELAGVAPDLDLFAGNFVEAFLEAGHEGFDPFFGVLIVFVGVADEQVVLKAVFVADP